MFQNIKISIENVENINIMILMKINLLYIPYTIPQMTKMGAIRGYFQERKWEEEEKPDQYL